MRLDKNLIIIDIKVTSICLQNTDEQCYVNIVVYRSILFQGYERVLLNLYAAPVKKILLEEGYCRICMG